MSQIRTLSDFAIKYDSANAGILSKSPTNDLSVGTPNTSLLATGTANANTFLCGDGTWKVVFNGTSNSPIFTGNVTLGSHSGNTVTINAGTVTLNNNTVISAATTKTLTINGGAGTNGLVLDVNNNVGIGTASPSYKLDIGGAFRSLIAANTYVTSGDVTGSAFPTTYVGIDYDTINNRGRIDALSGGVAWRDISINTRGGNTLVGLNGGNLLVGSVSPIAGYSNQISSTGPTTNRGCVIVGRTTAATSGVCGSIISYNGSNVVCGFDLQSNGANNSGYIQSYTYNAGVFATGPYLNTGGTSWTTASDEKLKDISGVIEGALEKTASLRAIEYTLKSDPSKMERVGLVAQEVQKVLPQAVSVDPEGFLGVQYTDTIPLLVAAIKELTTRLEALEAK